MHSEKSARSFLQPSSNGSVAAAWIARQGVRHLVLCTQPEMAAAHHLYEQAGVARLPERDWCPVEGLTLLAYGLVLPAQ